jgi:hypothetical protein
MFRNHLSASKAVTLSLAGNIVAGIWALGKAKRGRKARISSLISRTTGAGSRKKRKRREKGRGGSPWRLYFFRVLSFLSAIEELCAPLSFSELLWPRLSPSSYVSDPSVPASLREASCSWFSHGATKPQSLGDISAFIFVSWCLCVSTFRFCQRSRAFIRG